MLTRILVLLGNSIAAAASPPPAPSPTPPPTAIAILNFGQPGKGGVVGHDIAAADFEAALPALEKAGIEVVIFRVNAGMFLGGEHLPGAAAEAERFVTLISERYNPRFRTAAWVESALDAAAVAVWPVEELYFMPKGSYGAAVLETEPMVAAKRKELDAWLALGERASKASGRDPAIMRAMQSMTPLSATVRPDGSVVWANDIQGEHVVNRESAILTLSSSQASQLGISRGEPATKEELAAALGIASPSWVCEEAAAAIDEATRLRAAGEPGKKTR